MKLKKPSLSTIIFLICIALLVIPVTRQPIQVAFHTLLSKMDPSTVSVDERKNISYSSWQLKSLEGETLSFETTKDKVVFLNFWATWCPPCIAEFQAVQDLYSDYKGKVVFVLVSNESPNVIQKFLDKNGYDIVIYNSLTDYPEEFNPRSIPRTYLIDKNGQIVIDKDGAADWNSASIRALIDDLLL
ncbi:thiol-disulfide oxidoreductase [Flavobacteriales bacterium 34_180_T64]|nr:thiol-disulfide oxidoreductase [Flavobacteriales bacterium 34_180_T64]